MHACMHARMHAHTHNRFMAHKTLSGTTWVSRYQKKHSPTHAFRDHQSSLICFFHLKWSMASSLYNPRAWQSFSTISQQVFFAQPLGLAPSTSYSIHFFTQSLSSLCSTCPYHRNLYCCSTKIMSSNPSLSRNPLLRTLSCSLMPHIHLTILISARWSAAWFSFLMGQVSLACKHTTLDTTAVQSPSYYQWCILTGKQWYQLSEFLNLFHSIRILVSTAASASPSTLNMSHVNKTYPLTPDLHWHQYLYLCILYQLLDSHNLYKQMSILYTFIPLHFLCTHFWQLVHCIEVLPMPLPQKSHGHLSLLHYILLFPTNHDLRSLHLNKKCNVYGIEDNKMISQWGR